jgi:Tol biopolymer transport system component
MSEYRAILNPPNGTNGYTLQLDTGGDQEGYSGLILGTPINLGPMVNSTTDDVEPSISDDGLELYFASYRPGGLGDSDIWVAKRVTTDADWEEPINLGHLINSSAYDGGTCLSPDGLSLYFTTARGNGAVMVTRRESRSESWGTPEIAYRLEEWGVKGFPSLSSDNLEMYVCEYYVFDPDGFGLSDLWVSTRSSDSDAWNAPQNLGPIVNSSAHDRHPSISTDGLALFFSSYRPGGYGDDSPPNDKQDIWVTTRATKNDDWSTPMNLGPMINTSVSDGGPSISADGHTLYFYSRRPGGYGRYDIWQASIAPISRSSRIDSHTHLVQKLTEDDDGKGVMPSNER